MLQNRTRNAYLSMPSAQTLLLNWQVSHRVLFNMDLMYNFQCSSMINVTAQKIDIKCPVYFVFQMCCKHAFQNIRKVDFKCNNLGCLSTTRFSPFNSLGWTEKNLNRFCFTLYLMCKVKSVVFWQDQTCNPITASINMAAGCQFRVKVAIQPWAV